LTSETHFLTVVQIVSQIITIKRRLYLVYALDLDPTLLGAAPAVVHGCPGSAGSSRSVTEPHTASELNGQELVIVGMAGRRNGPPLSMRYDDDDDDDLSCLVSDLLVNLVRDMVLSKY